MKTILEGLHYVREVSREITSSDQPTDSEEFVVKQNNYKPTPSTTSDTASQPINHVVNWAIPLAVPLPPPVSENRMPIYQEPQRTYEVFLYNMVENRISVILSEFPTIFEAEAEVARLRRQGLPAFYATKWVH